MYTITLEPAAPTTGTAYIRHFTTGGQSLGAVFNDRNETMTSGNTYAYTHPSHSGYTYRGWKIGTVSAPSGGSPVMSPADPPPLAPYDGSHSAYFVYFYYDPPAVVTDIALDVRPSSATVGVGGTQQYEAWVRRSDGTEYRANDAAWSSSQPAVATIGPTTGLGTGVSPGTVTVTATKNGLSDTAALTVTAAAVITGDFDILPPTIHYRDAFSLKPKNIAGTNGCTYQSHRFRIDGRGEMASVAGQHTASTYSFGSYPYGIGVGAHAVSMKVTGSCGDSGWIGPKTLTMLGPANNGPPYFRLGWFANGDWTSRASVPQVVQGSSMMVRVIETPDSVPPSPSDPDGDSFALTGWDFSGNAWTQSLPGLYGFHPQANYLGGIVMNMPGLHTIRATMTDAFGAQYTASAVIEVVPPNPVAVISGPAQVKEGRPLPALFRSDGSYSPAGRSIDHARDEWTNKRETYATPGAETVRLHVYDDQGRKSLQPATHTLVVLPDAPPVAKLEVVPIGVRSQTYYVYNKSYSADGDIVTAVEYRLRYDSDNDSSFDDEPWTALTGDMNRAAFTPYRVGKYQLYVKATESYGKSDDTLSDPPETTTIDIVNHAPEVSFDMEGKTTQPDLSPERVYTPGEMLGWPLTQVNGTAPLKGKLSQWSVSDELQGGLGKGMEHFQSLYMNATRFGAALQAVYWGPFVNAGFGANGLSPYRPIRTNDPAMSQPLLIPTLSDPTEYEPVYFSPGSDLGRMRTSRTHLYFEADNRYFVLNKSKIGRYEGSYELSGSGYISGYRHDLLDGNPYDIVLDHRSIPAAQRPVVRIGYTNPETFTAWSAHPDFSALYAPQNRTLVPMTSGTRTVAYETDGETIYQVMEWVCNNCYIDWDGTHSAKFLDVRTYDAITGAFLSSSLSNGTLLVNVSFPSASIRQGNLVLQQRKSEPASSPPRSSYYYEAIVFDRQANVVKSAVRLPRIEDRIFANGDGTTTVCAPQPYPWEPGPDGEFYRYVYSFCGSAGDARNLLYAEKINPDFSLGWRTQLGGTRPTTEGSWAWGTTYPYEDPVLMGVNPTANQLYVRSYSFAGSDVFEYRETIDMTTGAKTALNAAYAWSAWSGKNFEIGWDGSLQAGSNRLVAPDGLRLEVKSPVVRRPDGSVYSSWTAGGVVSAGGFCGTSTSEQKFGHMIGDGLYLSVWNTNSCGTVSQTLIPWINKGTPSNEPVTAPAGFTLGQLLSPDAVSNHEIRFALRMKDADADRDAAGMSFRAADGRNRYAVETDGAVLALVKYVGGTRTVLQQTNYPFQDDTAVAFRIKALGSAIEVFVNDTPYFGVTDASFASGAFGPFSNKSYVSFGAVTTKEVKEPETVWDSGYALWEAGTARAEVRYANLRFADPEHDPMSGTYRWSISHTPKFIANQGMSVLHGQTYTSEQLHFDKVGVYDVTLSAEDDPHPSYLYPSDVFQTYRKPSNTFSGKMVVHRRPVAQVALSFHADHTVRYEDTSYDPDRWASASDYSPPEDGKNYEETRGIFERRYYYVSPGGEFAETQLVRPTEAGTYHVGVAVRDEYGAWSEWAVGTLAVDNPFPPNAVPLAAMTYPSGSQAAPTTAAIYRPVLQWTQTDADAGTVFRYFQVQVTNEANTVYVLDSGELAQNTSSVSAGWAPTADLPAAQKLRVRVRVNDGAVWSAWSPQTWLLINNAPSAALTFPDGTQANPTPTDTRRPTIRWSQTDPDPGAVFRQYEVEVRNEAGTVAVASSGAALQYTSSSAAQWTLPGDVPAGEKLRVRVRAHDGVAWSAWSPERWMIVNRPPTAEFTYLPAIVYEGDDLQLTNASFDPDGDALTYLWSIERPDGTIQTHASTHVTLSDVVQGAYSVRLQATDVHGAADEAERTVQVRDLGIAGQVAHTPEWEAYRQSWNERFPDRSRPADTFWAGEVFVLRAEVIDPGSGPTRPESVTATLTATGHTAELAESGGDGVFALYAGEMADTGFRTALSDGSYTMRFRVEYSNGHVETDDVPFVIAGNMYDVIVFQRRL